MPVLVFGWPWPAWLWYVTDAKAPRTARIGLATFVLMGRLVWAGEVD
jgi:hypothetical protein